MSQDHSIWSLIDFKKTFTNENKLMIANEKLMTFPSQLMKETAKWK